MSNCNGDASHEEIVNGYGENGDLEINNQENDNADDTENENGKNNSNQDSSNLNQDDEDAANRKLQDVVEKTVDRVADRGMQDVEKTVDPADRGMQDLRNIRKFSNAAQMMGTRKELLHSFYRKSNLHRDMDCVWVYKPKRHYGTYV